METVKRGYEPKDTVEFGPKAEAKLNAAAQKLAFLLDRGYDTKSASTFMGSHHLLSERQRLALARITSPRAALTERERKRLREATEVLVLDGFNTIITLEVALSGSLLLEGSVQVRAELHPSVDGVLSQLETVVTTDAIIMDKCGNWYNLNRGGIEETVPEAWVLRLEAEKWQE